MPCCYGMNMSPTPVDHECLTREAVSQRWQPDGPIISEDSCLGIIDGFFPSHAGHNPLGRGDDCAVLVCPDHIALSTDTFFENSHFRREYFTPAEVGAKALVSSVSDLAAAGAIPLGFSLGLLIPPQLGSNVFAELLGGMAHIAKSYDILLTGGDIAKAPNLGLCITVWGKSATPDNNLFFYRGQAVPGDHLFSIGALGLAKAGLLLLEHYGRPALANFPLPCQYHLCPVAHTGEGATLARLINESNGASPHCSARIGLMDVSDGLARDLPRLLGYSEKDHPSLGADILFPDAAIAPELSLAADHLRCSPQELMLSGGEDYALLGSCSPSLWQKIRDIIPQAVHIGMVTDTGELLYNGAPYILHGFDHFSG